MRSNLFSAALAVVAAGLVPMMSAPAYAEEAAAHSAHYSVDTTPVGTLLDDPAAVEVLKALIPTVYANEMFQTMGRSLTLKAVQQFEPAALSDEVLAKLQAEFDKLPAKK
ncbi:MAG: hypothetical protein BGO57_00115 [Sphingomonadales bacterium 63-6]|nr:MAG: hypothetical protein BGO57_00115 [Sphingomonadales bacterium 63-6]